MSKTKSAKASVEKEMNKKVPTQTSGVSPLGVVFLCLLTIGALFSAIFAFQAQLSPYLEQYFPIIKQDNKPLPGFVPVPMAAAYPAIDEAAFSELKGQYQKLQEKLEALELSSQNASTEEPSINPEEFLELKVIIESFKAEIAQKNTLLAKLETKLAETQIFAQKLASQMSSGGNSDKLAAFVALQTVQSKAISGQRYEDDFNRLVALLGEVPESAEEAVTGLEEVSSVGRPTLIFLQKEFKAAVKEYLQSPVEKKQGFWGKLETNLSSFIQIRRVDGEGDVQENLLHEAETALENGNVALALEKLSALDATQRKIFEKWIIHADAYIAVPKWLNQLQLALSQQLEDKAL
jgi:hypothetical protein